MPSRKPRSPLVDAARVVNEREMRLLVTKIEATAGQRIHLHTDPLSGWLNAQELQAELPTREEVNRLCGRDSALDNDRQGLVIRLRIALAS